ncbi:hypothetical protein ACFVHB_08945 [Kitasatospora sp. NPDC127111]|uniref:hypothetical protein n=1 Tax=Kitasatospora sp. NPDC127111 TaxID=3345363 RepID=UPI00363659DE
MTRRPTLYLRHGGAVLGDERPVVQPASRLGRASALADGDPDVSARREDAPLTIGATTTVPLTYDFRSLLGRYCRVTYPAP